MRLLLALLCATCLAAQDRLADRSRRSPSAADIAAGAKTFRSHCSPCHGINGEGGRGPNLASGRFYHGSSDKALLETISNGIPGTEMPGLFYSPDRIRQIVAYIRSLNAATARSLTGDAARGAVIFRNKGCPQCHRVNGEGGRLGPDLTRIGEMRSPDYLRRAIIDPGADVPQGYKVFRCTDQSGKQYEGFIMNEDTYSVQFIDMSEELHSMLKSELKDYHIEKTSKMPSYKGALSASELQDLVAWLSSLRLRRTVQ